MKVFFRYIIKLFSCETFLFFVINLVGLSMGLNNIVSIPINFLLKDELDVSPALKATLFSLLTIPWFIKPIFGMISDTFSICGYRRKPYFFIFQSLIAFTFVIFSLYYKSLLLVVIYLFIIYTSLSFISVIAEGLIVEKTKGTDMKQASDKISMFFIMRNAGNLLSTIVGGYLEEYMEKPKIFLIAAIFPLFTLAFICFIKEEKIKSVQTITYEQLEEGARVEKKTDDVLSLKSQIKILKDFMKSPRVYKPCIFIVIFASVPYNYDVFFYYYTNELKFSPSTVGNLNFVSGVAAILGIVVYKRYLYKHKFRTFLRRIIIIVSLMGFLHLVLIFRLNTMVGIPDYLFAFFDNGVNTLFNELSYMPLLVMCTTLCPKNIEATTYSFLTSVMNAGAFLGSQMGALLTWLFGIDQTNFTYLWLFVVVCNLMNFLPLLALNIVEDKTIDEIIEEVKKESTELK